jgi:hypothetical protein
LGSYYYVIIDPTSQLVTVNHAGRDDHPLVPLFRIADYTFPIDCHIDSLELVFDQSFSQSDQKSVYREFVTSEQTVVVKTNQVT